MPEPSRPQLVLNEGSLNFVLQLPARKRERLLQTLRALADTLHVEPMGIEKDHTGRDLFVRVIDIWDVTYWTDWENELRIVRIIED
jgi:hypothetical protein